MPGLSNRTKRITITATVMDYESIRKLIKENRQQINFGEFGHGPLDDWIDKAQARLGVKFPPSYIWWLKNYSGGEIYGDEIFSV